MACNVRTEVRHFVGDSPDTQMATLKRAVVRFGRKVGREGVLTEASARANFESEREKRARKQRQNRRKAKGRAKDAQRRNDDPGAF